MNTATPAPEFSDLAAARAALVTLGPDYVLCGGIDKPYRLLHCSTLPTYEGGEDGPIREPGDDVPSWSDVFTADELVAAIDLHAAKSMKSGDLGKYTDLKYASEAIDELAAQIDESRATVARLLGEIKDRDEKILDLAGQVAELHVSCFGPGPGDAERMRQNRDDVEADRGSDVDG